MSAASPKLTNVNVGVLGHVDSGKTSLCKTLSTVSSSSPQAISSRKYMYLKYLWKWRVHFDQTRFFPKSHSAENYRKSFQQLLRELIRCTGP